MPFSSQLVKAAFGLREEPVRMKVGGENFEDWLEVDIDSDIFTPADAFSLTGTMPDPKRLKLFREGVGVDVYVGDDRQMSGIVDDVEITIGAQARIAISGRDRASYLVDAEAKAQRFSHYTLKTLAEALLLPEWGIKHVIGDSEENRKVQQGKKEKERFKQGRKVANVLGKSVVRKETKIDVGQTVANILDAHCKRDGAIWWMTAQGDLFIGKPQYTQAASYEFLCYKPGNPESKRNNILPGMRVKRSMADRYSEIVVVGESGVDSTSASNTYSPDTPVEAKRKKHRAVAHDDDLVARGIKRRMIIEDHDALSSKMCQEKANEDVQKRRLQGLVINISVDGFKQDGKLFTVDTIAKVVIEEAGIDGEYWISQRKFSEKRDQRRTSLTLHEKGIYLP